VVLFLFDILRNHSPDNADSAVDRASEGTPEHGLRERGGESNTQTGYGGTNQADQQHESATTPLGIGDTAPRNGRRELGGSKGALEDTGLGRNVGVREILVEGLELVEHVSLQRGDL
jgi:hypothetical protein